MWTNGWNGNVYDISVRTKPDIMDVAVPDLSHLYLLLMPLQNESLKYKLHYKMVKIALFVSYSN